MAVLLIAITAIMLCAVVIFFSYRYAQKAHNSIDHTLDRILAGDESLRLETTGEDRISKLAHKAGRVMDMYITETQQTKKEKNAIQEFISDMAHQMKTPLSGISMYADLLIEGTATTEEQQEFFARIKSGTDNLQWMMESLIKMSRLEIGAIQLSPAYQNIKQTIFDSITRILASASKKNIDITVEDFTDIPLLHDEKWTQEAISNILENAIKYSVPDSTIHIAVEPLPMHTKINITDNGIGISRSDWHLIFKRFYRGKNAKSTEGAGLGLYLVTLIMEKQGGYVMVDSDMGEYTTFSLFLQNELK